MMEKEYKKAKRAYEQYNVCGEYELEKKILRYIEKRINANRKEIEELLRIRKEKYKYEEIEKVIQNVINKNVEYKKQINLVKMDNGFVKGRYKTSVGIVIVESYDLLISIEYMLKGIQTRNAIIISDIEYEDNDVKNLILLIIKEALKKFNIDKELINIMPYEECDYEKADRIIYTYGKNKGKIKKKEESKKVYIYIENDMFREIANKEYERIRDKKEVEIIEGKLDEVEDILNKKVYDGVIIYTKDRKTAYRAINIIRSKKVYINAILGNKEIEESKEELLMNKEIMYEL